MPGTHEFPEMKTLRCGKCGSDNLELVLDSLRALEEEISRPDQITGSHIKCRDCGYCFLPTEKEFDLAVAEQARDYHEAVKGGSMRDADDCPYCKTDQMCFRHVAEGSMKHAEEVRVGKRTAGEILRQAEAVGPGGVFEVSKEEMERLRTYELSKFAYNRILVELQPGALAMIDKLVAQGLNGEDRSQVCERLICRQLEQFMIKGAFKCISS